VWFLNTADLTPEQEILEWLMEVAWPEVAGG